MGALISLFGFSLPFSWLFSRNVTQSVCETLSRMEEAEMPTTDIFQQFYSQLVEKLPMNDPNFTAKLYSARLLSDYLKEYVESRSSVTRAEKATRFLDDMIKPSMTTFNVLLYIMMEDNEHDHVKKLAKVIRHSIRERSRCDNGEFSSYVLCIIYCAKHKAKPHKAMSIRNYIRTDIRTYI